MNERSELTPCTAYNYMCVSYVHAILCVCILKYMCEGTTNWCVRLSKGSGVETHSLRTCSVHKQYINTVHVS